MPNKDKNIPKRRFKEFENADAWELRKLSEFVSFYNGLTYSPNDVNENGTLVLRSSNVKDGEVVVADNVYVDTEKVTSENVKVGDIVVVVRNGSKALIGKHAVIKESMPNTVIGAFMSGIRTDIPFFVNALLDTKWFEKEIEKNMGATINQITGYMFSNMEFIIPSIAEQSAIGTFFSTLDRHITLHQRKLDKLKSVKQAYLSEMFPAEGERVPKRRFPGFTDAWELRRFSELAEIRRGLTYSPVNIRLEGIRVLRSSNIDEDTFTFGEDDVFVDKGVVKSPLVKEGDILITAANGSSRLVGKHTIIKDLPENSAIHGGFMLLASCRNPEFINSLMSSAWYTKFINLYVAGGNGAIGNLNKHDLDEQNVLVPSQKEQSAIGTFFSTLDQQITLHQRKS